jgi:hypothetical protein
MPSELELSKITSSPAKIPETKYSPSLMLESLNTKLLGGISGFRGGIGFGHRSEHILRSKRLFRGRYTPGVRVSETASDLIYFAHSYLTYLSVSPIAAALPSAIARNLYSACFFQLLPGPQLPILSPIADTTFKKESNCSPVLQTSIFISHSPF